MALAVFFFIMCVIFIFASLVSVAVGSKSAAWVCFRIFIGSFILMFVSGLWSLFS